MKFPRHIRRLGLLLPLSLLLAGCIDDGDGDGNGGSRTVVVFGDSISADFNYPGTPPWPELLKSMRPKWTLVNRARGNERIAGVRAKAPGGITEDTDVAVVLIGSVNVLNNDTASFAEDLAFIIRTGRSRGARVVVGTIPPLVGPRSGFSSSVDRLNQTIRQVASAEGAVWVDIFSELDGSPERFPDGLHPDLDGQRILAVAMREKI